MYNTRNDLEITGAQPIYSIVGDMDVTQQFGPTISPKTDVTQILGGGASYGITPGSTLTALLMALGVCIAAYVIFCKGGFKL
jgi:hypothetical protein